MTNVASFKVTIIISETLSGSQNLKLLIEVGEGEITENYYTPVNGEGGSFQQGNPLSDSIGAGNPINNFPHLWSRLQLFFNGVAVRHIEIKGSGKDKSTWNNFSYDYFTSVFNTSTNNSLDYNQNTTHQFRNIVDNSYATELIIKDISLKTPSKLDAYAIRSRDTQVILENVNIDGYSGNFENGQNYGGGILIEFVDTGNCTLKNINVSNCCRGIHFKTCENALIEDCNIVNCTDTSIALLADTVPNAINNLYTFKGCKNCTVKRCNATNSGNYGVEVSGTGGNNKFEECVIDTSVGVGVNLIECSNDIEFKKCTFININTEATQTPWGDRSLGFNGNVFGVYLLYPQYGGLDYKLIMNQNIFHSNGQTDKNKHILYFGNYTNNLVFEGSGNTYDNQQFMSGIAETSGKSDTKVPEDIAVSFSVIGGNQNSTGCFLKDTLIKTKFNTYIPIQLMKPGDQLTNGVVVKEVYKLPINCVHQVVKFQPNSLAPNVPNKITYTSTLHDNIIPGTEEVKESINLVNGDTITLENQYVDYFYHLVTSKHGWIANNMITLSFLVSDEPVTLKYMKNNEIKFKTGIVQYDNVYSESEQKKELRNMLQQRKVQTV